jgi:hypothetical protein
MTSHHASRRLVTRCALLRHEYIKFYVASMGDGGTLKRESESAALS